VIALGELRATWTKVPSPRTAPDSICCSGLTTLTPRLGCRVEFWPSGDTPCLLRDGRGRPWRGRRDVLNGILFILRTGAPWADLPDRYPSYQTCHRHFQQWVRCGIMRGVLEALAEDLRSRGGFDLEEAFIDGSFAPAKKGVPALVSTWRGT
jgi:transposase